MKVTKKDLLFLIENNIKEMAMDFDTPDRPDQGLQDKLSQGETPLKKVPFPKTGNPNQNFQELLASERYREVVRNLRRYVGDNTPVQRGSQGLGQLVSIMMSAHNTIVQTERNHKRQLEELAVELVFNEMGLDRDTVDVDAKIVGMGEIDTSDFEMNDQGDDNPNEVDIESDDVNIENEVEIYNELRNLDLEKAKRRLVNAIIQGASKKGHYMYHLVSDRLTEITGNPNILNLYGTLMSINDINYWQLSDQTIKNMSGSVGGTEKVERPKENEPESKAKIIARGINFPVLVHEIVKGVLEFLASDSSNPKLHQGYEEVLNSEDTLQKEMWDLRLGPAIWDRIKQQFPEDMLVDEDKKSLQLFLFKMIFDLPAKKFLVLMKEILGETQKGQELLNDILDSLDKMFNQDDDYEDSISEFNDDLDDIMGSTDDIELSDFLSDLGIDWSGDDDEEDDDDE